MVHDVILNKREMIERCLKRVSEEYVGHEEELESDFLRQDSVILNLQRACQAAIDLAHHLCRMKNLGIPQDSRDSFSLLEQNGDLDPDLSLHLKKMVGFRNIAVHDYQRLDLAILRAVIEQASTDLIKFACVAARIAESSE